MKWLYMYKITGDAVLYGDTVLARSFFDAVDVASTICRAAGYSLVGVMPPEVVSDHCSCVFKLHKL